MYIYQNGQYTVYECTRTHDWTFQCLITPSSAVLCLGQIRHFIHNINPKSRLTDINYKNNIPKSRLQNGTDLEALHV